MRRIHLAGMKILAAVVLISALGPPVPAEAGPARLTILFTHDLHSSFLPRHITAPDGSLSLRGGYAKLLTAINQERKKGGGILLVDAGDFSMGTLFHTAFADRGAELRLMAAMGYDAMTLGNHDFDFRPAGLARALEAARASEDRLPVMVASNVIFSPDGKGDRELHEAFRDYPVLPYAIIEREGIRIGVFGLMGRDAQTDSPFARPVTFGDPVEAAKRVVETLKKRERAELVVCLSHSGTSPQQERSEDEALAAAVPEIDVIISGHTHTVLARPLFVGRTIIVSAGRYGAYLGKLALLHEKGKGAALAGYELIPIAARLPDDPALARLIGRFQKEVEKGYLAAYGSGFQKIIAESAYDLETLESIYADPRETGLGNLITDAFRRAVERAEGPRYQHIHAAIEPIGLIRDSLRRGPITISDLFNVLPLGIGPDGRPGYPLVAYYITGRELKDLLEVETTVAKIKKDAHLQFSGVRFTFNPHRVPFDRVTSVLVRNAQGIYEPLEGKKLYRVCLNLYTAQMVGFIRKASYGLLSIKPRDRRGRPIGDTRKGIIDADPATPGIQELKEWTALASYLKELPDTDKDGIPDLPSRYGRPEGRFAAVPSWDPVALLAGGNWITWGAILAAVLLLFAALSLLAIVVRLLRRRLGSPGSFS